MLTRHNQLRAIAAMWGATTPQFRVRKRKYEGQELRYLRFANRPPNASAESLRPAVNQKPEPGPCQQYTKIVADCPPDSMTIPLERWVQRCTCKGCRPDNTVSQRLKGKARNGGRTR